MAAGLGSRAGSVIVLSVLKVLYYGFIRVTCPFFGLGGLWFDLHRVQRPRIPQQPLMTLLILLQSLDPLLFIDDRGQIELNKYEPK